MPTNLPPEYQKIELRYRAAQSTRDKIACLEEMLSVIPKHKGTDKLRADLRKKLSKLKSSTQSKKSTGKRESVFHIDREGAGQIAVIGPTNVGKSALITALTNATPEISPSPFTTWKPVPAMMEVRNVQIQLIDTPPLDRGLVEPDLVALIKRVDVILLLVDLQAYPIQQLEDTIAVLQEHCIGPLHMADQYTEQQRMLLKPLLVGVNKNDDEGSDEDWEVLQELLGDEWPMLPVSATTGRHIESLKQVLFDRLEIMCVYSKPPGKEPDLSAPFVLKHGSTVPEFAGKVHQDFITKLKTARIWGSGVHDGQMVGRDHVLQDGDVVELRL